MAPLAAVARPLTPRHAAKPALTPALKSGRIRRADDAGLDNDAPAVSATPSKRLRVTFDTTLDVNGVMEEVEPDVQLDAVRVEIKQAIHGHAMGDSEQYDILKDMFSDANPERQESQETMRVHVLALTSCVSLLGKTCSGLVHSVVNHDWTGRSDAFVKAYLMFLGNLASAQGSYVGSILHMLVDKFTGVSISQARHLGLLRVTRAEQMGRVHSALKYLLRLIPSASGRLSQIISSKFPYPEDSNKMHITYINNLLKVMEYAPELKTEIFALITERLVKLDVQMQVDLDDLDADIASTIVQTISLQSRAPDEDDLDDDASDASSVMSDDELTAEERQTKAVSEYVEKMDSILDILFTQYSSYFADPHGVEAEAMFEMMLAHFANIILPTYRSRHTQFLLFHFAQSADHLVDQFSGTCVHLATDPGRPAVLKQAAAAYLASFVARGAHVPAHVVCTVFELLGNNLDRMQSDSELTCRGPDLQRYGTFYAMTQALLYIFCFRWRDLITSSDTFADDDDAMSLIGQDLMWVPGIKETMGRIIYSRLNPLKICSPSIVEEFAKIAHHLRFMYVYPLLETNKRIRLSQFTLGRGAGGVLRDAGFGARDDSWHQLDAYFPFDPYQLPTSKRWLEGDYIQWRGIPGLNAEEEDDSEDSDDHDDEELDVDTATDDEEDR